MQASKLQLKHYFLDELAFKVKKNRISPGQLIKLEPTQLDIEVRFNDPGNAVDRLCELRVSLRPEAKRALPLDLRISMFGLFTMDHDPEDESADILFQTNAPSILFSAARELLMSVTGRSILWSIMLPTVIFATSKPEASVRKTKKESKRK